MIKYNMSKHSGPLFEKSNFSLPGMINFSNFFITPPKTFQLSLGVAGKRNTDFVSFVTILPIFAAKRPDNRVFIALFVKYPLCFLLFHTLRLHKLKNCGIVYLKNSSFCFMCSISMPYLLIKTPSPL